MVQDKPLRTSWQQKMKERQERKLTKDFARHLEEEKQRRRQVTGHPAKSGSYMPNTCVLQQTWLQDYDLLRALGMRVPGGKEWSRAMVAFPLYHPTQPLAQGHAGDLEVE